MAYRKGAYFSGFMVQCALVGLLEIMQRSYFNHTCEIRLRSF